MTTASIHGLYREWLALKAKAAEIERELLALPVRSASDLAAKVAVTAPRAFPVELSEECQAFASVDLDDIAARLAVDAAQRGTTPPTTFIAADGAPSREVLTYCKEHGVSLDWVFRDRPD